MRRGTPNAGGRPGPTSAPARAEQKYEDDWRLADLLAAVFRIDKDASAAHLHGHRMALTHHKNGVALITVESIEEAHRHYPERLAAALAGREDGEKERNFLEAEVMAIGSRVAEAGEVLRAVCEDHSEQRQEFDDLKREVAELRLELAALKGGAA